MSLCLTSLTYSFSSSLKIKSLLAFFVISSLSIVPDLIIMIMNLELNTIYSVSYFYTGTTSNIPNVPFYLKLCSLLFNLIFLVDLGFVRLSLRLRMLTKILQISVATCLSAFCIYHYFSIVIFHKAVWVSLHVILFFANVAKFSFLKSHLNEFFSYMVKLDSILNVKFPHMIFFTLISFTSVLISIKCLMTYLKCTKISKFCMAPVLEIISHVIIIPSNDFMKITCCLVYYSIYYRLKILKCIVKSTNHLTDTQYVYKSFLDASEKIINTFNLMVSATKV